MATDSGCDLPADNQLGIIYGAEDIARFLGVSRRQVYRTCERHLMPHFRIGAIICARRATLVGWIEAQEANPASASAPRGSVTSGTGSDPQ